MIYAGFWLRLVAFIVDGLILTLTNLIINPGYTQFFTVGAITSVTHVQGTMIGLFVIRWLYFTLMESSSWQATLGKKLLGIKVTDEAGLRISFGRANGRFFSKIISGFILGIGFLMVAFTAKKQGLHDMIAHTLVVKAENIIV